MSSYSYSWPLPVWIYIYISISIYKFTSVYLCVRVFALTFFEIHEDADAGCRESKTYFEFRVLTFPYASNRGQS